MATDIFHPPVLSLDPTNLDSLAETGERLPIHSASWGGQGFLDLDAWERGLAGDLTAGEGAGMALLARLRRAARQREPIAIGTLADPYGGRRARRTRRVLEICRDVEGLALSLTTRSPWVLRDLGLLAEIDAYHAVSIDVPITAADPAVARRLEPAAAEPADRFATVAALAEQGISTAVWCLPIVAGENDREEVLAPLFAAAREAGARDVLAAPLFLRPSGPRRGFGMGRLGREIPGFGGVRRHLDHQLDADEAARRLAARFRRLRLEHGFPLVQTSRG